MNVDESGIRVVKKAFATLVFISQGGLGIMIQLHKILVRPHQEYCSV